MPRKLYAPRMRKGRIENVNGNGTLTVDSVSDFGTSDGSHSCVELEWENKFRVIEGENPIAIFQEVVSDKWNFRVGLEFVRLNCCPFCGVGLC